MELPPNARGCRRCRRQGSLGTGSPSCGQHVERQLASFGYSARLLASCYFLNVLEVSPFLTSPSPESSVMLVAQGMQKGLLGGWWYTSRGTGGTLRPSGLGPLIRTSPPSSLSAMREGHLYRLWKAPSPLYTTCPTPPPVRKVFPYRFWVRRKQVVFRPSKLIVQGISHSLC